MLQADRSLNRDTCGITIRAVHTAATPAGPQGWCHFTQLKPAPPPSLSFPPTQGLRRAASRLQAGDSTPFFALSQRGGNPKEVRRTHSINEMQLPGTGCSFAPKCWQKLYLKAYTPPVDLLSQPTSILFRGNQEAASKLLAS